MTWRRRASIRQFFWSSEQLQLRRKNFTSPNEFMHGPDLPSLHEFDGDASWLIDRPLNSLSVYSVVPTWDSVGMHCNHIMMSPIIILHHSLLKIGGSGDFLRETHYLIAYELVFLWGGKIYCSHFPYEKLCLIRHVVFRSLSRKNLIITEVETIE